MYIAPLKALVRERIEDWKHQLCPWSLNRKLVELTGRLHAGLARASGRGHHRLHAREVGRHLA